VTQKQQATASCVDWEAASHVRGGRQSKVYHGLPYKPVCGRLPLLPVSRAE